MSDVEVKYVPVYVSWLEMFEMAEPETVKNLIVGSIRYMETGEVPDIPKSDLMLFYSMRGNLDASRRKLHDKHDQAVTAANTRWHPAQDTNADACESMQTHAIENEKESERDNEIESETDTENETERERETGEEKEIVRESKRVRGEENPRKGRNPSLSLETKIEKLNAVISDADKALFSTFIGKAPQERVESYADSLNDRYHAW